MPNWNDLFGDTPAWQVFGWIAAAGLLIGLVIKLWPFVKNAVAIVDALVQLPAMKKQIDSIHHETHRNDGSSIKDSTVRIEKSLEGLHGRMDVVERSVETLAREDESLWAAFEDTQNPEEKE